MAGWRRLGGGYYSSNLDQHGLYVLIFWILSIAVSNHLVLVYDYAITNFANPANLLLAARYVT
jgi:hypothetical protein